MRNVEEEGKRMEGQGNVIKGDISVSVIVPVFNEEKRIRPLHSSISQALKEQPGSYEIIYVDDGSTDKSFVHLSHLALHDAHVCVVRLRRSFGQTAAIAAGLQQSSGAVVVFLDGDLQNDPQDIPRLLAKLAEGYDVVSGWCQHRQDAQLSGKLPALLLNRLISLLSGTHLHDVSGTLKAYRREIFQHVRLHGEMQHFIPAYAALAGAAVAELEVSQHARQFGTANNYGLARSSRVILDVLTVKFMGRFGRKPLYTFAMPGMAALTLGSIGSALLRGQQNSAPRVRRPQRNPLLVLSALLTVLGLQSIIIGLLGEILILTSHEAQSNTSYVIHDIFSQTLPTEDQQTATLQKVIVRREL